MVSPVDIPGVSLSGDLYDGVIRHFSDHSGDISGGGGRVFRLEGKVKCSGEKQILYRITVTRPETVDILLDVGVS